MTDYLSFLGSCVAATESSVDTIDRCIMNLQPGVSDLPRLTRVLANEHLYLLLPDPLLQEYKTELADSLVPQINTLVERAEEVIERDEKKMKSLEERLAIIRANKNPSEQDAQQTNPSTARARTATAFVSSSSAGGAAKNIPTPAFDAKSLNPAHRRKLVMLKGKRERLEKELARLS
ncbi:hypothetical protein QFC22_004430 [Naganishia vaughanmartiniae]|uniref:Uncharacterized protein n=1 Tax=Naganishia vaughanmartiniae TaxID=1424756 RepID=A0ACC2X0K9_9TREE|nr:hypothetical protein QFC22_004430 [Naganishia vaughanmartiniae]